MPLTAVNYRWRSIYALTREEVTQALSHLKGVPHLLASLLYGAGLRVMRVRAFRASRILTSGIVKSRCATARARKTGARLYRYL